MYGPACRYLISQHPEVDAKLAAELDEAGLLVTPQRPAPRAMEYSDLARLTYLGWVCKVGTLYKPLAKTRSPGRKRLITVHKCSVSCAGVMA